MLGLYYYTYSTFALISGAALDRWGAKYTIPVGIFFLALGLATFGVGVASTAYVGRLLQGAGAAFAFVGAVYLATHGFPSRYLATAIGFTQMMGMLGGSAGQFGVAPLVHGGPISWQQFWYRYQRTEQACGGRNGAAMIPHSIIKEVNPDNVKGNATGAINFLVFAMSAFGAPAAGWLLQKLAVGGALTLDIFDKGATAAIACVIVGAILALFLKETGFAVRKA